MLVCNKCGKDVYVHKEAQEQYILRTMNHIIVGFANVLKTTMKQR